MVSMAKFCCRNGDVGGVPCGFKAPFACGGNGKLEIYKDSEVSKAILKMSGPF